MNLGTVKRMIADLDPRAVDFHAARWTSGETFQRLIVAEREGAPLNLRSIVRRIARECRDCDGADYGHIPCLSGRPLEVWSALRARYL